MSDRFGDRRSPFYFSNQVKIRAPCFLTTECQNLWFWLSSISLLLNVLLLCCKQLNKMVKMLRKSWGSQKPKSWCAPSRGSVHKYFHPDEQMLRFLPDDSSSSTRWFSCYNRMIQFFNQGICESQIFPDGVCPNIKNSESCFPRKFLWTYLYSGIKFLNPIVFRHTVFWHLRA